MKHTTKLLSIIAVTCMLLGLMGCQPTTGNIGCSHENMKITKNATCTEAGSEVCLDCSFVKEIPALGHNFEKTSSVKPTCTEDGHIGYKCSRCNATKTDTLPHGHNFNATTSICSVCGKHEHCECEEQTTFCGNDFVVYICSDKENPDNPDLTVTRVFCIEEILSNELETLLGGKVSEFIVGDSGWTPFDEFRGESVSINSPIYVFLE